MSAIASIPGAMLSSFSLRASMMIGILVGEADVEQMASRFENKVEKMWREKKGTAADELLANCRMGHRGSIENLDAALLLMTSMDLAQKHEIVLDDERLRKAPFGWSCLFLYTMQDVDIDR